jgi:hypothetical protein
LLERRQLRAAIRPLVPKRAIKDLRAQTPARPLDFLTMPISLHV